MANVSNLKVALQAGSDSTYYATWTFSNAVSGSATNTNTGSSSTSTVIKVGTLVKIKSGSKYYNGTSIPSWVMNDQWYVYSISGNRVVLNKNKAGTQSIMSPVHKNNLTVVAGGGSSSNSSSSSSSGVDVSKLDHYEVKWWYFTGDGVPFEGSSSSTTMKNATYSPPSHTTTVKVGVKPVSKKYKSGNSEKYYWTGTWKYAEIKTASAVASSSPEDPTSAPSVEIDKYTLKATVDNITDSRADKIQFEVYNGTTKVSTGTVDVVTARAVFTCNISAGGQYRVRYRVVNTTSGKTLYSDWSPYSGDSKTIPSAVTGVKCSANGEQEVKVTWSGSSNATSYEVQYTTNKSYFDSSSGVSSTNVTSTTAYITGLDSGDQWFFRVRAINEQGESGWSSIVSTVIGTKPAAPTIWSLTSTARVGEDVVLYWVHNSEDGSYQTKAEIELTVDGVSSTITKTTSASEDEEEPIYTHTLNTSSYPDGAEILWKVRTMGILPEYGDWSAQREVNVYAPPTLTVNFETPEGEIGSLPFEISAVAGPDNQTPVSYYISIVANETYMSEDRLGNEITVPAGTEVYSKVFNVAENEFAMSISAGDVTLEDSFQYTLIVLVTMDSGLTAEVQMPFKVNWEDRTFFPDASIGIDYDSLYAFITPMCVDETGGLADGITLSVYRREYDGSFTEIGTDLENDTVTTITDPHPSLDYARYRIVARDESTGRVTYEDIPGEPILEPSIVIQWDEKWSSFDYENEDVSAQPPWVGSMVKLPYNVDVSENNSPDVALIEYIGRENPVGYYGTQRGITASWSTEIPKTDKETLYALRRLSRWMGNVYVREPSGVGYWAQITVSLSVKHLATTIPVGFEINKVEGGV